MGEGTTAGEDRPSTDADRGEAAFLEELAKWTHRRGQRVPTGQPSAQDLYTSLMKTAFGPALRQAGFRGSSGRFELPSATHWVQVGFQKSFHSDASSVHFTVNLSVIPRDAWSAYRAARPGFGSRPSPNTRYGTSGEQTRIGLITPEGRDLWWTITPEEDPGPVRDDVLAKLFTYGIPWLKQHCRPLP